MSIREDFLKERTKEQNPQWDETHTGDYLTIKDAERLSDIAFTQGKIELLMHLQYCQKNKIKFNKSLAIGGLLTLIKKLNKKL